jgi:hypothetical protein
MEHVVVSTGRKWGLGFMVSGWKKAFCSST